MTLYGLLQELNKIVFVQYSDNLLINECQFSNNDGESDGAEDDNREVFMIGTGGKARWLRAFAAVPEDLVPFPAFI